MIGDSTLLYALYLGPTYKIIFERILVQMILFSNPCLVSIISISVGLVKIRSASYVKIDAASFRSGKSANLITTVTRHDEHSVKGKRKTNTLSYSFTPD